MTNNSIKNPFKLISVILLSLFIINSGCQGTTKERDPMIYKDRNLTKNIIGRWGALNDSHPVLTIVPDSIFNYDNSTGYHYQIVNKNLVVHYQNGPVVFRNIKVNQDTLVYIDDKGAIVKGYRIKTK